MVGITPPRKLRTAGLFHQTQLPTINGVMRQMLKGVGMVARGALLGSGLTRAGAQRDRRRAGHMTRHSQVVGALLGVLLTTLAVVLIAVRMDEVPRVVNPWPLLAAFGTSVMTWWIQGLIYSVLARPQLKYLRVGEMFRIDMAGMFVALISPLRGAELPYKAFLMKRLGLSVPEGTNVVGTRVLLDVAVLTPAALWGLVLTSRLAEERWSNLLLAGLVATVAAAVLFVCRRVQRGAQKRTFHRNGSRWRMRAGTKISGFLRDAHVSFASYWRPGNRATLLWALALTVVYWALRLCAGPLALTAVGWSGNWLPVVVAQLLLVSVVLPLAPTPGGSGARELGLGVLLATHVPEGQLLSGLIVYTALSHWLPLIASAFFAAHELSRGVFRGGGNAETITQVLAADIYTTAPSEHVLSINQEPEETRTWRHNKASPPTHRISGGSRV
jgi:uncharacterized protein (TIRG00374 family)